MTYNTSRIERTRAQRNRTTHHDHASGTQADHLGRPAVLPRHRLRRRGQLPPEHLCRAPRMARPLRRLGAVRGRRHGRVLLADPRRLFERGAHRRRDLQGQGADPGRRRRPHPRGHRIRQGSAAPGRQRRAADAALPDRSLAGRHRRSRRAGLQGRAGHRRDHLQPRQFQAQRRHARAPGRALPEPDRLQGRRGRARSRRW